MSGLEIRAFEPVHVDDAARLLADRHRPQRAHHPALDPRYEEVAGTRPEIEALLGQDGASGTVALRGSELLGYLFGVARDAATWGPNVWVEAAGHAAAEPTLVRELYAVAADRWIEEGRSNHHVVVPAADGELVDAWFTLDFGQQHVHGIRAAAEPGWQPTVAPGLTIRAASQADIAVLAELEVLLPRHQRASPVFSGMPVPTVEAARAELEADFGDERFVTFVAEHDGRVIGSAVGSSIELSSMHAGVARPVATGFLGFAAVVPDARGLGAGRALGGTVIGWSRDAGYDWVVTDWRSTNLQASRAWSALGFRPLFRRMHRTIR